MVSPTFSLNKDVSVIFQAPDSVSSPLNMLDEYSFKVNDLNIYAEDNPEAYFPNFLYYSITTANALIDYLYDPEEGGFYQSADEHWSEASIVQEKRTYDQAHAILALLKLSEAVINETQRVYALNIAETTGEYLISNLYDNEFDGFFSSSTDRYKRPGIEGKAIQALLALFEVTGNVIYREKAEDTFEFIDSNGWDISNGGYYYKLSHSGTLAGLNNNELYESDSKRVDHNAIMGSTLLDLYVLSSDGSYLNKANTIYELMNKSCRNYDTGLFYGGYRSDGMIHNLDSTDLFINTLMLEFISKLYTVTDEQRYLDDISSLLKSILFYFWDDQFGGFYATHSYSDQEERDVKKYTERQLYAIRALDEAFKLTNDNLFYNLIYDIMEFLNTNLYDQVHEGYIQLASENADPGDPAWKQKYSITQALAISELANLWLYSKPGVLNAMWLPSIPRPQDPVTIVVAAFDSDGIAEVLCNYSIDGQPYEIVEMKEDRQIGNMYNTSFNPHPADTTINFNIIVNDTLGNEVVRGSYFFLWQYDIWSPHVELIGLDPGDEIPVHSKISMTVSAHDVPTQGSVSNIRMYFHLEGKSEDSKVLTRVNGHIWQIELLKGFNVPGSYVYYFEAIDNRGNFGYTAVGYIRVMGKLDTIPIGLIIGVLFLVIFITPASIAGYKEYQKKNAKTTLGKIKQKKGMKRRRRTRRTRNLRN
jgi:mannose/cellobiose epimerase-like protein (N-acyl-D-glucosamine 2-epimerase family)